MKRNGFTILELLIVISIISILLVIIGGAVLPFGISENYSNGYRTGTVTKFSKKGLLYKSFEGELLMSQFAMHRRGSAETSDDSNVFEFSCTDDEVARKIEGYLVNGKRIVLHYHQWFKHPAKISTAYVIDEVKEDDGGVDK